MSILINALLTIWAIIAAFMILVILMQRPKSEGLGAAFGGGMTENLFGAQTTNVLVKFTSYLSAFFFLITFALSILYAHESSTKSVLREELLKREATTSGAPATTTQSPAASPAASAAVPAASVAPSASVAASASPKKP
jgi:preprotein translocase subunit SecG